MNAPVVLDRLRAVAAELDDGRWPEDDGLAAAIDLAVSAAPEASPGEKLALSEALATLEAAVVRAMDRVAEALREGGVRSAALRGYDALRAHTTGQNVSARA